MIESMENIVIHGFCNVTQRLSSIQLEPEEGIILTQEPVYSGTIRLHGFLDGEMLFLIPEEMAEQIVFQMSHGRPMSEAEWDGYFKEYLNIVDVLQCFPSTLSTYVMLLLSSLLNLVFQSPPFMEVD